MLMQETWDWIETSPGETMSETGDILMALWCLIPFLVLVVALCLK
jgi:hypothetical protein